MLFLFAALLAVLVWTTAPLHAQEGENGAVTPPAAEQGAPAAEQGAPAAEQGAPAAEQGAPAAEQGAPAADQRAPGADAARPAWDRAVEAMQYRRHAEAIPLLRLTIETDEEHRAEATRLLAHAHEQEGDLVRAETVLRDALEDERYSADESARIAFDLATLYRRSGRTDQATEMYTTTLEYDGSSASAYLNRANLRVESGAYGDAVEDYELYLALRPRSPQRPQIEQMLTLLAEEIEAERIRREEEERRRAAEEEQRRREEEERRRREEEERRLAEERRQQMLDSVLESLGSAQEETESFELENEEIREYEEELDILD